MKIVTKRCVLALIAVAVLLAGCPPPPPPVPPSKSSLAPQVKELKAEGVTNTKESSVHNG
ncbi:MAG: hypothetical protein ABFS19_07290 [Thermodesulfobacteriota bacterium]